MATQVKYYRVGTPTVNIPHAQVCTNANTIPLANLGGCILTQVFIDASLIAPTSTGGYTYNQTMDELDFTGYGGVADVNVAVYYYEN